jgi:hypothetical protein
MGTLVLGDVLVEGRDVLFDVCTPVAGLDELPHPRGGVVTVHPAITTVRERMRRVHRKVCYAFSKALDVG